MNQFERFKNDILAIFDTGGKKFKDFSRQVGKTFMEATANEKTRDNEFRKHLEEVTGFKYPATLSVGIANHSRGNNASPELAMALYFLCKIDPTYNSFVPKIEQKLLGRGKTFFECFKWEPETLDQQTNEIAELGHFPIKKLDSTLEWMFAATPNAPFDGQFASFALEAGQVSKADCPIGVRAELYIESAYDQESGFRLGFKSADIVLNAKNDNPLPLIDYTLNSTDIQTCKDAFFAMVGTDNFRFFRLSKPSGVLEGNYDSLDVIFLFQPLINSGSLNAKMTISISDLNVSSPDDVVVTSDVKRAFIARMMAKEMLPEPDPRGNVTVHSAKYVAKAIEPGSKP